MSAPTINATASLRRISRRDLAGNQVMWRATAGMYGVMSVSTVAVLATGGAERDTALLAFLAGTVATALVVLRIAPPAIDSWRNHAVISTTYLFTAFGLLAFQPHPEAALAIAIFIGPLIAARLDRRQSVFRHLIAATALLAITALLGGFAGVLNEASLVTMLMIAFAMWCLGFSCLITLEAAETQGDDLEDLVRRDPLTGVGNRRMLLERLDEELGHHLSAQRPLSVIAVSLDGFKALNGRLGHGAGDELLREVAGALVSAVRPQDAVVRQGGDEFCLILVDTPAPEARHVVDAVRAALSTIQVEGRGLTGDIGAATCPDDATTRAALLEATDRHLVASKRRDQPD